MANKKTLYVGGLADDIDVNMLKSAFLPFGDIVDVNLPMDHSSRKHKGFAFIEFQLPEDAADAIDNMDNGEILGKTIRVNIAKPQRYKDMGNRPIWADDNYLRKAAGAVDPAESEGNDDSKQPDEGNDWLVKNLEMAFYYFANQSQICRTFQKMPGIGSCGKN